MAGIVMILAACGADNPPRAPTSPACMADLAAIGANFTRWPSAPGGTCGVDQPIVLRSVGPALQPPIKTACAMAAAWAAFIPEVDRIARRTTGSGVRTVLDAGSWSCRVMTGNSGRMSLHASGRAIDISGFVLADGRRITVRRDWYRKDSAGQFLRAVGDAACDHFQVVLGPPSGRYHFDHLHVDVGPWKLCEVR